jgi:TM2 domain-containing membrane protein YozV
MGNYLVKRDQRSVGWAYALWLPYFFGIAGLHRFYSGRYISGTIWLLTVGLCGVGQFIDLFFIPRMIEDHNHGRDVW